MEKVQLRKTSTKDNPLLVRCGVTAEIRGVLVAITAPSQHRSMLCIARHGPDCSLAIALLLAEAYDSRDQPFSFLLETSWHLLLSRLPGQPRESPVQPTSEAELRGLLPWEEPVDRPQDHTRTPRGGTGEVLSLLSPLLSSHLQTHPLLSPQAPLTSLPV